MDIGKAVERAMCPLNKIAELVDGWCAKANGPPLSEEARIELTKAVHHLARGVWWHDQSIKERERSRDARRMRSIAKCLQSLRQDLPPFIELWRGSKASPVVPLDLTLGLLELVKLHQKIIDGAKPRKKGALPSLELSVTTDLSRKILELSGGKGKKKQADAFANEAVKWLTGKDRTVKDGTIGRARSRRTQMK